MSFFNPTALLQNLTVLLQSLTMSQQPTGSPQSASSTRASGPSPTTTTSTTSTSTSTTPHTVTAGDLRLVRAYLSSLGLPAELIHLITEQASYYPTLRASLAAPFVLPSNACVQNDHRAARLCLLSAPLPPAGPDETWRARSVTWTLESHDQGWGGEAGCRGTYRGSYTTFAASIVRPLLLPAIADADASALPPPLPDHALADPLLEPAQLDATLLPRGYCLVRDSHADGSGGVTWHVQRNVTASGRWKRHVVRWCRVRRAEEDENEDEGQKWEVEGRGPGKGFVEALRPGDRVVLWAQARYMGWANHVRVAEVEVQWDI